MRISAYKEVLMKNSYSIQIYDFIVTLLGVKICIILHYQETMWEKLLEVEWNMHFEGFNMVHANILPRSHRMTSS